MTSTVSNPAPSAATKPAAAPKAASPDDVDEEHSSCHSQGGDGYVQFNTAHSHSTSSISPIPKDCSPPHKASPSPPRSKSPAPSAVTVERVQNAERGARAAPETKEDALPKIDDNFSESVISMGSYTATTATADPPDGTKSGRTSTATNGRKHSSGTMYLDISGQFPYFDDRQEPKPHADTAPNDAAAPNDPNDPNDDGAESKDPEAASSPMTPISPSAAPSAGKKSAAKPVEETPTPSTPSPGGAATVSDHAASSTAKRKAKSPESEAAESEWFEAENEEKKASTEEEEEDGDGNAVGDGDGDEDEEEEEEEEDGTGDLSEAEVALLEQRTLRKHGYLRTSHIARTLQGSVFNGRMSLHRMSSDSERRR